MKELKINIKIEISSFSSWLYVEVHAKCLLEKL